MPTNNPYIVDDEPVKNPYIVDDPEPSPIDIEASRPQKSMGDWAKVGWDLMNKPAFTPFAKLSDMAVAGQDMVRKKAEQDWGVSPKALDIFEAIPSPLNQRTQRVGLNIADTFLFSPMTYATLGAGYLSKAAEPLIGLGLGVPQMYDAYESGKEGYQDIKSGNYTQGSEKMQQALASGLFGIAGAKSSIDTYRGISKAKGAYKKAVNEFDHASKKMPIDPNDVVAQETDLRVKENIVENQRLAQAIDKGRQVTPELQDVAPFELFSEAGEPQFNTIFDVPERSQAFVMGEPEGPLVSRGGDYTNIFSDYLSRENLDQARATATKVLTPEQEASLFGDNLPLEPLPVDVPEAASGILRQQNPGQFPGESRFTPFEGASNRDNAFFRNPEPEVRDMSGQPRVGGVRQEPVPITSGLEGMFQEQDASPFSPIEQASRLADDTNKLAYEQSQEKRYREKEIERRIQQMDQEPDLIYDEPEVARIVNSKSMDQAANLSTEAKRALSEAAMRIREPGPRENVGRFSGMKDWMDEFKGKASQLTRHYLSEGGQLAKEGMKGISEYSGMKDFTTDRIESINELVGKDQGSQLKVIQALQDRKNANKILKTPEQRQAYQQAVGLYDFFRERMGEKGIATLDDYFTHLIEVADSPEVAMNMKGIPKDITSKFFEKRTGGQGYSLDLIDVLDRYSNNMSRALAYSDLVKYYSNEFLPNIKKAGRDQNANIHQKYIKDFIDPTSGITKKGAKSIDAWKKGFYGMISFITPTAVKNLTQRHNADMLVSDKAKGLGRILRNLGDKEIDAYLNSDYGGLQSAWMDTNVPVGDSFLKKGFLGKGDESNWKYSRSLGMAEHIANSPEFKALKQQGISDIDAFTRVLADPAIRKEAMAQGEMIGAQAQHSSNAAFRPEALRTGGMKSLFTMLTRFPLGQTELYARAMGGTKSKAYQLMMKGYSPDASIADTYVSNLEVIKASKKAIKDNPELKSDIQNVVKTLKTANKLLKSKINTVSPLSKTKSFNEIAKMTAMNALIGQAFLSGGNSIRAMMGLEERKDKPWYEDLAQEAVPISGKGFDLTSPLLPRFGDTVGKYGSRLGWSQVPVVNKINAMTLGLPESMFNEFFGIGKKDK